MLLVLLEGGSPAELLKVGNWYRRRFTIERARGMTAQLGTVLQPYGDRFNLERRKRRFGRCD